MSGYLYRSLKFSPRLILVHILANQAFFYASLSTVVFVEFVLLRYPLSVRLLLDPILTSPTQFEEAKALDLAIIVQAVLK